MVTSEGVDISADLEYLSTFRVRPSRGLTDLKLRGSSYDLIRPCAMTPPLDLGFVIRPSHTSNTPRLDHGHRETPGSGWRGGCFKVTRTQLIVRSATAHP